MQPNSLYNSLVGAYIGDKTLHVKKNRAGYLLSINSISTFYAMPLPNPKLTDSCIVHNPVPFLLHARFCCTCRHPLSSVKYIHSPQRATYNSEWNRQWGSRRSSALAPGDQSACLHQPQQLMQTQSLAQPRHLPHHSSLSQHNRPISLNHIYISKFSVPQWVIQWTRVYGSHKDIHYNKTSLSCFTPPPINKCIVITHNKLEC